MKLYSMKHAVASQLSIQTKRGQGHNDLRKDMDDMGVQVIFEVSSSVLALTTIRWYHHFISHHRSLSDGLLALVGKE